MRGVTKDKLPMKILVTLAAVLGLMYVAVAWYVQDLFLYGTRIGMVNASWLTVEETEERFLESLKGYSLEIKARDGQIVQIDAEDIDLGYDFGDQIQQIMDGQNSLEWLPALVRGPVKYDPEMTVVYDEEKLSAKLEAVSFLNPKEMTAPVDAKLLYSEEDGFVLQRSVAGNTIDEKAFGRKLKEALEEEQPVLELEAAGCYREPKVTEDDSTIRSMTDRLDEVSDFEISYAFGEKKEVIDRDVIWSFYRLDSDGELVLKESAVKDYVSQLADTYDTVGAEREFQTTAGDVITVSGGPYGWMINQKKEYEELLALVKERKSVADRQPVYSRTGFAKVRGTDDIGDTYIEISIDAQHMWYYENGTLYLDTDVVTGNGGKHTKRGVAYIHNKARNATLVGEGYVSFVKYWMKVWNGIGIHDASWRSQFGGKIYLTNGSHGCINTPLDNVIKLYNRVEIGTPGVIY